MAIDPNTSLLKCKIIGRNLVNGTEKYFAIREGAVFTDNFNEELDSGTIVIPQLDSEIEIEPYDSIYISGPKINNREMLVDSFTCTQTCLSPAQYTYEITLMSKTKLLEGMLCPSLAITRVESSPRTVWYYLDQYLKEYCTRASVGYDNSITTTLNYKLRVKTKFNAIECPEMQWNEPTLREVLTDLMLVADCIPVIKGNEIDYMDLSTTGLDISNNSSITKNINYITSQQSSSDYVSELKMSLVNTIGEEQICKVCDNVSFRNYDTYMITTDNVRVETSNQIYNLESILMYCTFKIRIGVVDLDMSVTSYEDVDIELLVDVGNYILEYSEWITKDIYYAGMNFGNTVPSTNYQNTCLYWKRGAKGIHNFENKVSEKLLWINNQISVLELILHQTANSNDAYYSAVAKYKQDHPETADPNHYSFVSTATSSYDWKTCRFKISYQTIGNHVFLASKGGIPRNKRQVVDNQTNSYVNAKNQGILEYAKANRLGNKIKCINGRFSVMSTSPVFMYYEEQDIPDIKQKYGNYVIFKKEIAVYKTYIKVNYYAAENYVLKNYFTGIKSKARSWKILDGNEAFVRADVIKIYINPNTMSNIEYPGGFIIPVYNTIQEYYDRLNYCFVKFKNETGSVSYPQASEITYKGNNYGVDYYMMEFQKVICGNSLLLTIRCVDNAIVGKYVNDNNHDIGGGVKAMTQKNCKYVDANGENFGGVIKFARNFTPFSSEYSTYREAIPNLYPATISGPISLEGMTIPFKIHKDNKEITQITVQIEINEDATDMFIGK